MITLRRSGERGHFDHGWLRTYHTFSFSDYYDPRFMGFRHLRVINEDYVAPAEGFDEHPHSDMEIVTYILEGALEHRDSMGNGSVIRPGDVQRMSAGTGVTHSEFNASKTNPVHLLQIWIFPEARGIKPGYEQTHFSVESRTNRLKLLASRDGSDGSVTIHQDAKIFGSLLGAGKDLRYENRADRHAWIQLVTGELELGGQSLGAGDGAAISGAENLVILAKSDAHFLLFDLS